MLHPLRYAAQHGFELVVAQNLQHGRTARWDKVMLLRQLLRKCARLARGAPQHATPPYLTTLHPLGTSGCIGSTWTHSS